MNVMTYKPNSLITAELLSNYKHQDIGLVGFDEQEEEEKGFYIETKNECEPSFCLNKEGVPTNAW